MSANTVNQIIELLEDGYTSCTISKYAMREIKALQEKCGLTTHALDLAYNCRNCGMQTKPSIRCGVCGFIIRQTSDE